MLFLVFGISLTWICYWLCLEQSLLSEIPQETLLQWPFLAHTDRLQVSVLSLHCHWHVSRHIQPILLLLRQAGVKSSKIKAAFFLPLDYSKLIISLNNSGGFFIKNFIISNATKNEESKEIYLTNSHVANADFYFSLFFLYFSLFFFFVSFLSLFFSPLNSFAVNSLIILACL